MEAAKKRSIALPKWTTIRDLSQTDSDSYQDFAFKLAKDKEATARIHLDLAFWRSIGPDGKIIEEDDP